MPRWRLGALLLFALVVRLWVLVVTWDQPVWWDEAEYLLFAKHLALGTPDSGWFDGRPIGWPLVLSGFYAVGLGEGAIRIGLVLVSLAAVALVHRIGRRLHGEDVGLLAAWLFACFYLPVFYTGRVMCELPHLTLVLAAIDLFLSGRPRQVLASVPVMVLATLVRFPAALALVVVLGADALGSRGRTLRTPAFRRSLALGGAIALPYGLWAWARHGDPLHAWRASSYLMPPLELSARLEGVAFYARWLGASLGVVLTALCLLGLGRALWRRQVLVPLWAAVPLLYCALVVRPLLDRFVILALPAVCLLTAEGACWLAAWLGRWHRLARPAALLSAGALGAAMLLPEAEAIVRARADSYAGLQSAGRWLAAHAPRRRAIVSSSVAQLTYYSERYGVAMPADATAFAELVRVARPYVVVSAYEAPPAWLSRARPEAFGLALVAQFPVDHPVVRVFESR